MNERVNSFQLTSNEVHAEQTNTINVDFDAERININFDLDNVKMEMDEFGVLK